MDVVVVREGKNLKGRVLGVVLGIFGKRVLGRALAKDRQGHRSPPADLRYFQSAADLMSGSRSPAGRDRGAPSKAARDVG